MVIAANCVTGFYSPPRLDAGVIEAGDSLVRDVQERWRRNGIRRSWRTSQAVIREMSAPSVTVSQNVAGPGITRRGAMVRATTIMIGRWTW